MAVTPINIDASFFIRKINIPNTGNAAISERLNSFIAQYKDECLLKILGYPLYKLLSTEDSERMTNLISGAEYTNVTLRKWRGLIHDTNLSLIANYIYVKFQEDSASLTTGVSTSTIATEGGNSISPADKMIDAWNAFSEEVREMCFFLWSSNLNYPQTYPEFTKEQSMCTLDFSRPINFLGA